MSNPSRSHVTINLGRSAQMVNRSGLMVDSWEVMWIHLFKLTSEIWKRVKCQIQGSGPTIRDFRKFVFSTAIDGKIKAWLYDNMGSRVDYDAPGHWCTTMLYSADDSRQRRGFIPSGVEKVKGQ
ncbi:Topless-related 3 [Olea europaea subsp. europaea]|uniref:Topless-related 3 n=1 Tax=Olea europaea subsp. europaea TaxID=158383 RepID=A0A8S0QYV7_OLEEU|nr:Topless-related 3 [Olea europaea subsp. europaea]